MPINSCRKGKVAERRVCKLLSDHFNDKFNRVPASGAIGSTHNLYIEAQRTLSGDIICPPTFIFSIESKSGYDIEMNNLFKYEKSADRNQIIEFCKQAMEDASRTDKLPMVIYTKDRRPSLVIIPKIKKDKKNKVNHVNRIKELDLIFLKSKSVMVFRFENSVYDTWYLFSLEEFLSLSSRDFFYKEN